MQYTSKFGLLLPENSDFYSREHQNQNMQTLENNILVDPVGAIRGGLTNPYNTKGALCNGAEIDAIVYPELAALLNKKLIAENWSRETVNSLGNAASQTLKFGTHHVISVGSVVYYTDDPDNAVLSSQYTTLFTGAATIEVMKVVNGYLFILNTDSTYTRITVYNSSLTQVYSGTPWTVASTAKGVVFDGTYYYVIVFSAGTSSTAAQVLYSTNLTSWTRVQSVNLGQGSYAMSDFSVEYFNGYIHFAHVTQTSGSAYALYYCCITSTNLRTGGSLANSPSVSYGIYSGTTELYIINAKLYLFATRNYSAGSVYDLYMYSTASIFTSLNNYRVIYHSNTTAASAARPYSFGTEFFFMMDSNKFLKVLQASIDTGVWTEGIISLENADVISVILEGVLYFTAVGATYLHQQPIKRLPILLSDNIYYYMKLEE